jgi:hypothetical protein
MNLLCGPCDQPVESSRTETRDDPQNGCRPLRSFGQRAAGAKSGKAISPPAMGKMLLLDEQT